MNLAQMVPSLALRQEHVFDLNAVQQSRFQLAGRMSEMALRQYPVLRRSDFLKFLNQVPFQHDKLTEVSAHEGRGNLLAQRVYIESDVMQTSHENQYISLEIREIEVEKYPNIPPVHVLQALKDSEGLFDSFQVIYPDFNRYKTEHKLRQNGVETPLDDPLLCGKLSSLPDMYFVVAVWLYDLRPEDLLNLG